MTLSQKILVCTLVLSPAIFLATYFASRKLGEADCAALASAAPEPHPPFNVRWHPAGQGTGGRWQIHFDKDRAVAPIHVLVEAAEPPFEGFTTPFLLRSDEGIEPRTAFQSAPGIRFKHRTSYAKRDPSDLDSLLDTRHEGIFPVPGGEVAQAEGKVRFLWGRSHTPEKGNENAVDIEAPMGTPVLAMRSGVVVSAETRNPDTKCDSPEARMKWDNVVVVLHEDGTEAVYGHLMQGSGQVSPGHRVEAGQPLARVGMSGSADTPHLHVEVGAIFGTRGYRTLPLAFRCAAPVADSGAETVFVPELGRRYCP